MFVCRLCACTWYGGKVSTRFVLFLCCSQFRGVVKFTNSLSLAKGVVCYSECIMLAFADMYEVPVT